MIVTVRCLRCGDQVKRDHEHSIARLRQTGEYGFGDHVRDPRAFVMREMFARYRWLVTDARIGKTTVSMLCPDCNRTDDDQPRSA